MMIKLILPLLLSFIPLLSPAAELVVRADRPGAGIKPTMFGLFFEDINYAADGGLYAEMVKNRSFEFPDPLMGWDIYGCVTVSHSGGPFPRNPRYVTLSPAPHPDKATGLANEGYFGVAFREGEEYRLSLWARSDAPSRVAVELVDPSSQGETQVMARSVIDVTSSSWTRYSTILRPSGTVARGKLRLFLDSPSPCSLEHISLFPVDTWKGHENGLRKDLAQMLADLHPGVFRFPGGCIVEGTDLATRYQWKNTVGPVENRPLNENRWHYTFSHRFFPDYYQSNGLGFYEYFLLSEEIGAEPLPVLSVGLACQYQNKGMECHVPVDSLGPYIQDALDLIEFANGDASTRWGALRASMGHPEPFGLKYIAIGNEQWGPEYVERLAPFIDTLRRAHPDISIVGSSGPGPSGPKFDHLWPEMRRLGVDLVDEHFYADERFFIDGVTRYDTYPRTGPGVFAGEYACHGKGKKRNHFNASLMEAAFMTGLERNADVVHMATYAPLFAHIEGWQWRPDLIWFDNLRAVPTASYYVQQLYAANRGTRVLPSSFTTPADSLYASASMDETDGTYIVKVANLSSSPHELTLRLDHLPEGRTLTRACATTLASPDGPEADNVSLLLTPGTSMPVPSVRPVTTRLDTPASPVTLPPASFTVIRIM